MVALVLGIDEQGHAVTYSTPVEFNEDGGLMLQKGPDVECILHMMRMAGRNSDGSFLDMDVIFRVQL